MALDIRISASEAPSSEGFYITDETNSYNASTAPGGWGSPNPDIADVLECSAIITLPDPTTFLPSTDPALTITIDVYYGTPPGVLPNTTGVRQFISAVDDLGYDEVMQNGIYSIKTINLVNPDESVIESNLYYMLVYNGLVCCITKQYLTINLDECGDCLKKDSAVWNTMMGQFALDGAYWAWYYAVQDETGDFSKCADYLEYVTNICANCADCGC